VGRAGARIKENLSCHVHVRQGRERDLDARVDFHVGIVLAVVGVPGSPDVNGSHESCSCEKKPLECSENSCSLCGSARSPMIASNAREENSECNKTSKPKDHGQEFCSQDAIFMRRCFEAYRGDGEVRECEDCPHRAKEEEVCFGGGTSVIGNPVAHDVGHEAQDDDAKDCLGGAKWEGVVECHGGES